MFRSHPHSTGNSNFLFALFDSVCELERYEEDRAFRDGVVISDVKT
jgi:hypothetical protein